MRTMPSIRIAALVALAVAATGLASSTPAQAAAQSFHLCAVAGTVDLPGAAGTPVWGFATAPAAGQCSGVTPTLPGPQLEVHAGDQVSIDVTNALPGTRTVRLEIPGVSFDPGAVTAESGQTVTVTFTASDPGTYLYQSSGDAGRQTAMGLYGALLVRPATAGQAYDAASTAYDAEQVVVLSELDPAFNANPDGFDLTGYKATYWMINGKSYPDTLPGIAAAPGQRLLLRYLNAGADNTTMTLLGLHEHVVARDAHLLGTPIDAVAETIGAGATEDAIITMPNTPPPVAAGFALYNRQLHLTNGPMTTPTPAAGGMLTFIHP